MKKFPYDEMFLMTDALLRFRSNEITAARYTLEKLVTNGVEAPLVLKTLGDIYLALKLKAEAVASYKKCVEKFGGYPEIHVELVRLYYETADFLNAILELKHIPEDEKTLELKKIEGVCNYYREDYKAALSVFTDILSRHPADVLSLMYAGDISLRFEKNYKAEFYWEAALKIEPETLEERAYLSRIHLFTSDYEHALKLIETNLLKLPDHYLSIFTAGLINICEDKLHPGAANWNRVFNEKRDLFMFEFELIKKSLKENKMKELVYKLAEPEYKPICDYIKERCDIK
jgi:predicted Zn-dependent protease